MGSTPGQDHHLGTRRGSWRKSPIIIFRMTDPPPSPYLPGWHSGDRRTCSDLPTRARKSSHPFTQRSGAGRSRAGGADRFLRSCGILGYLHMYMSSSIKHSVIAPVRSVYVQLSDCEVPHLHYILRYREEFFSPILFFALFCQLEKRNLLKNRVHVRKTFSRKKEIQQLCCRRLVTLLRKGHHSKF